MFFEAGKKKLKSKCKFCHEYIYIYEYIMSFDTFPEMPTFTSQMWEKCQLSFAE